VRIVRVNGMPAVVLRIEQDRGVVIVIPGGRRDGKTLALARLVLRPTEYEVLRRALVRRRVRDPGFRERLPYQPPAEADRYRMGPI
jgi:hypothetical protein